MTPQHNINLQEDKELRRIYELISRNLKLFIIIFLVTFGIAFFINRYATPVYQISSSILIKENQLQQQSPNSTDFLYSNLFGRDQNFQNELWIIKSYPVLEKTIRNLDLSVNYFTKGKFNYYNVYHDSPFVVNYVQGHFQPLNVKFDITFIDSITFIIKAESKKVQFHNFLTLETRFQKEKWIFSQEGKLGELIENDDIAIIVKHRDSSIKQFDSTIVYAFDLSRISTITNHLRKSMDFITIDKQATVVSINLKSETPSLGIDIVNTLMDVYSEQSLERKNYLATITIEYIEKQLSEISDSLSQTEDYLQRFRSSRQLLNIGDQATAISTQYMDLQNQLAELVSKKKYYDFVAEQLKNDNFSNLMLPASIGISDALLNRLMSDLITAQAQRTNLIENNQERNPLVQRLNIEIENLKKTITENINAVANTTSISVDEMNRRIEKIRSEMSRLPETQRQLGTIERKFRLNDAIYNYLMEKHAEAKITKASNLPDNIIIEPAKLIKEMPISPNRSRNYIVAFVLGLAIPFGYVMLKNSLNNKIDSQDDIDRLTDKPTLGKILHNRLKTKNVMFEFPNSNMAESFRALRTNLDFYVRGGSKKVIMITSCNENEGKSFVAANLAMSYAQLGRKTILLDFDLRKPKNYFNDKQVTQEGLSSYMIDKVNLEDIIKKSPHEKLDFIQAGILPPNPVELIALEKTELLLLKLKEIYDIIVLDTTPLGQVSDAYLLIEHSDIKIMVARYNVTLKSVFSFIMKDLNQKNVDNICIVLNDNRFFSDQYGYGYGYYNKKGLKNRIKMKFSK